MLPVDEKLWSEGKGYKTRHISEIFKDYLLGMEPLAEYLCVCRGKTQSSFSCLKGWPFMLYSTMFWSIVIFNCFICLLRPFCMSLYYIQHWATYVWSMNLLVADIYVKNLSRYRNIVFWVLLLGFFFCYCCLVSCFFLLSLLLYT